MKGHAGNRPISSHVQNGQRDARKKAHRQSVPKSGGAPLRSSLNSLYKPSEGDHGIQTGSIQDPREHRCCFPHFCTPVLIPCLLNRSLCPLKQRCRRPLPKHSGQPTPLLIGGQSPSLNPAGPKPALIPTGKEPRPLAGQGPAFAPQREIQDCGGKVSIPSFLVEGHVLTER